MSNMPYEQQDLLMHYGTIGMKWGIRRYQNPDGSLTDAGRKRYGKQLSKQMLKAEKTQHAGNMYQTVKNSKFAKAAFNSPDIAQKRLEYKRLQNAGNERVSEINKQINETLIKKYGRPILELDNDSQNKYLIDGMNMMKDMSSKDTKLSDLHESFQKASKDLEKALTSYTQENLGEYGSRELKNPINVKYDTQTGKLSQQTIADRAAIELLRYVDPDLI